MQFDHRFAEQIEDRGSALRQMIVSAPSLSFPDRGFGTQPPVPFETLEQRIQRPGTDVVPVPAQFREHPLTNDRMLSRVVKDVDLPEPKENLAGQQLRIERCHGRAHITTTIVNEYIQLIVLLGGLWSGTEVVAPDQRLS
jgi:hypothetical protein